MKIVIIHLGKKGAGPVYTLEMAKALHNLGCEVFYYASESVENRKNVEAQTFKKRFFKTYNSKLEYLLSVFSWYKINRVIKSIKKDQPDVIYSSMNDLWSPFIFPKLKGITRVKTIHDVGIHEGNDSKFNVWWNNTNFHDAEKFVILSNKFVPKLIEKGISNDKIVVIPHAGFNYYTEFSNFELKSKISWKNILFFGRIDQYKGIDVLLKALPTVVAKHPDLKLSIVGNGDISRYKDAIEMFSNNVILHNRWIKDEEVASYVNECDFMILPYTHATQSGVIPLAYAFSKPVIATRVGCLDEQVLDGETGVMCDGNNPAALAEAMIFMLDNPERTKVMGETAKKYMESHLTWNASAITLIDFL